MQENDKIIAMTRALARAIQMDERYLEVKTARENNADNAELQEQIGRFNLARFNLNAELSKEQSDNGKVEIFNKEVQEAYDAITANKGMTDYYEAKGELDKLVNFMQAIIVGATNGSDPDTIEEPDDCTHDCSTCGGCG